MTNAETTNSNRFFTGEVVFTSYDGMRAEGTGELDFLTFETKLLDMRTDAILGALPSVSSGNSAAFVQVVFVKRTPIHIIGVVKKIRDFNKREGVVGAAVSVPDMSIDMHGVGIHLQDVLFPTIEDAIAEKWKDRPLPDHLNLLHGVPKNEISLDCKMRSKTEMFHELDGTEVTVEEVINASFTLLELPRDIGRVIISPSPRGKSKAADRHLIETIHRLKEDHDAAMLEMARQQRAQAEQARALKLAEATQKNAALTARISNVERKMAPADTLLPATTSPETKEALSLDELLHRQSKLERRLQGIEKKVGLGRKKNVARPPLVKLKAPQAVRHVHSDSVSKAVVAGGMVLCIAMAVLAAALLLRETGPSEVPESPSPNTTQLRLDTTPRSLEVIEISPTFPQPVNRDDCAEAESISEQLSCEKTEQDSP